MFPPSIAITRCWLSLGTYNLIVSVLAYQWTYLYLISFFVCVIYYTKDYISSSHYPFLNLLVKNLQTGLSAIRASDHLYTWMVKGLIRITTQLVRSYC